MHPAIAGMARLSGTFPSGSSTAAGAIVWTRVGTSQKVVLGGVGTGTRVPIQRRVRVATESAANGTNRVEAGRDNQGRSGDPQIRGI